VPDVPYPCYSYDGVGNIVEMKQVSSWTRAYTYAADSNRLASTTEAGGTKSYRYNARGAMTSMAHLDLASTGLDDPMVSDFRDQLAHVTLNSGGDTVRFHYDPTRERVRKVWTKGAIVEERIYLGGWELWRKHNGSGVTDERETLHVLDGESRIAMVETLTVSGGSTVGSPSSVSRFQLGNHLGSACLELDADGELLTYEEFFPYGSTSWWAERSASPVSHKRYRYIGKEKDEETGLHYHSARYLAGWLGRWTSSDPAGLVDGVGRYSYSRQSPVRSLDMSGFGTWDATIDDGGRTFEPSIEVTALALLVPSEQQLRLHKAYFNDGREAPKPKLVGMESLTRADYRYLGVPDTVELFSVDGSGLVKRVGESEEGISVFEWTSVVDETLGKMPTPNAQFLRAILKGGPKVMSELIVEELGTGGLVTLGARGGVRVFKVAWNAVDPGPGVSRAVVEGLASAADELHRAANVSRVSQGARNADNVLSGAARKAGSSADIKSADLSDWKHSFSNIVENFGDDATRFDLVGADGVRRDLYQLEGSLNGKPGVFEWIIDEGGEMTHRFFKERGEVNGVPIR
jgi:RHS repeat-associated protein